MVLAGAQTAVCIDEFEASKARQDRGEMDEDWTTGVLPLGVCEMEETPGTGEGRTRK